MKQPGAEPQDARGQHSNYKHPATPLRTQRGAGGLNLKRRYAYRKVSAKGALSLARRPGRPADIRYRPAHGAGDRLAMCGNPQIMRDFQLRPAASSPAVADVERMTSGISMAVAHDVKTGVH